MHTLAFLDPGHFHAALTLRERNPRVGDEIFVYAPPGRELDDFLALLEAFNRRPERPTAWRPVVRAGAIERLEAERPGDVVILAGRNDGKARVIRRLHDAGFHVLADKPWLTRPEGLADLRHALAGGPAVAEIMTGRHEIASVLTRRLVADAGVFGDFRRGAEPAIEIASVHHLEKTVDGRPLRRPAWFFDVRVQGDGLADIPTHMVDQAQRLVAAAARAGDAAPAMELLAARRWATLVPRALFARVTGEPDFPEDLGSAVGGGELSYQGNANLSFRVAGVTVALDTRWDLAQPAGGGDAHRSVLRGTRAEIRVAQDATTGFRRRLSVRPLGEPSRVGAALHRAVDEWQEAHPGVTLQAAEPGWEIRVPAALDTGHESHFALVLEAFLERLEMRSGPGALAADTLAKYALLAGAMGACGSQ